MSLTDAEKLNALAIWFDCLDEHRSSTSEPDVQADLRRIANRLEAIDTLAASLTTGSTT